MMLEGELVRLRAVTEDDMKVLFRMFNDPAAYGEYEDFDPIDWYAFEKEERERGNTPGRAALLLVEKKEGKAVVGIIFHRVSHPVLKNTEIGYAILNTAERGKGYASEAARLVVDYLFLNRNIERIEAITDTRNIPSQRVLEKCSFQKEGTLRKARFVAAAYRDCYIYSLLREEWSPPKN